MTSFRFSGFFLEQEKDAKFPVKVIKQVF
jgi:hypothetical protein